MPFVHDGMFGGPKKIPCCGWIATEPVPFVAAGVPVGETQSVIVADGLKTYSPRRCGLLVATCTLELLTFGVTSAFGLGYVLDIRYLRI